MKQKIISIILIITLITSIASPAIAADNSSYSLDKTSAQTLNTVLLDASTEQKDAINNAVDVMKELRLFDHGSLTSINIAKESSRTNNPLTNIKYTIDYGKYVEEIVFTEITDEVVSYTIYRDNIVNTIDMFNDGRLLLNGHGISVEKKIVDTNNNIISTYSYNTSVQNSSNESTLDTSITPRVSETYYTETCPYGNTGQYSVLAYTEEQSNYALYVVFGSLTFTAFKAALKVINIYAWSVVRISELLYNFLLDEGPMSNVLSYKTNHYYHRSADATTGYINAIGAFITQDITKWYAKAYYAGSYTTSIVYKNRIPL